MTAGPETEGGRKGGGQGRGRPPPSQDSTSPPPEPGQNRGRRLGIQAGADCRPKAFSAPSRPPSAVKRSSAEPDSLPRHFPLGLDTPSPSPSEKFGWHRPRPASGTWKQSCWWAQEAAERRLSPGRRELPVASLTPRRGPPGTRRPHLGSPKLCAPLPPQLRGSLQRPPAPAPPVPRPRPGLRSGSSSSHSPLRRRLPRPVASRLPHVTREQLRPESPGPARGGPSSPPSQIHVAPTQQTAPTSAHGSVRGRTSEILGPSGAPTPVSARDRSAKQSAAWFSLVRSSGGSK
ncbi:formin-like protein 20 [Orycteropus afer afer]|uniref:Formin-like protein 20 n=1 Tax=Orycteropus afer afer TaxID=1230840 RepID=A0AC54ZAQ6_ORYAF|nr:formin-like protein 20 [Orycteropus afer afer]